MFALKLQISIFIYINCSHDMELSVFRFVNLQCYQIQKIAWSNFYFQLQHKLDFSSLTSILINSYVYFLHLFIQNRSGRFMAQPIHVAG